MLIYVFYLHSCEQNVWKLSQDTRNIARVVVELAKRGIRLEPNTAIYPGRRWQWMGKPGQILEEYCFI